MAEALIAVATFVLAAATFLLALFTYRMTVETRAVAARTADLGAAADRQVAAANEQSVLLREQVALAREELAHVKAEALAAEDPQINVELIEGQTIGPVRQREGMNLFYVWVNVRLVNYGGPAVIDRLHITGAPAIETRPYDVYGFLPTGARMDFALRFDIGNAAEDLKGDASIPVRAHGTRQKAWRETLFYVNLRHARGGGEQATGWYARVSQPMTILGSDTQP